MGKYLVTLAAGVFAMAMFGGATAAQAAKKTIWEGVFTDAQAARGETVFKKECGHCHRDDLKGSIDGGPPLRDKDFFIRWKDTSLGDMVNSIAEIMPNDEPGSLKRQEYVDILTFLLKFNGVPSGTTELPTDAEGLGQVMFTETPK